MEKIDDQAMGSVFFVEMDEINVGFYMVGVPWGIVEMLSIVCMFLMLKDISSRIS